MTTIKRAQYNRSEFSIEERREQNGFNFLAAIAASINFTVTVFAARRDVGGAPETMAQRSVGGRRRAASPAMPSWESSFTYTSRRFN